MARIEIRIAVVVYFQPMIFFPIFLENNSFCGSLNNVVEEDIYALCPREFCASPILILRQLARLNVGDSADIE